ncbi:ProQ/FINO family protein [Methylobacterium aquaticum]|uniref:ProQ/FINO family protein n=1 Tax=Methylobacterium aquaticum TaxID=270351 RepID=UPI003D163B11
MRGLEKLFVLSTERPAVFPAEVGDSMLPPAIGMLQALKRIAVPRTTTTQIKRVLSHSIEGMAYLLSTGSSGAQRHDVNGTQAEPASQVRSPDSRKRFKMVKERRDTICEARRKLSMSTRPARSSTESLAAWG